MLDQPSDPSPDDPQVPACRPTDYARLARPFDHIFQDTRGGVCFDYPTGEQVRSRLNEELGVGGWSTRIVREWLNQEADEVAVCMELTAYIVVPDPALPGELLTRAIVKQNYGSQKVKRGRGSGTPLDIGFDYKGAATDALKKCAAEIGVGLYLWKKAGGRATAPDDGVPDGAVLVENGQAPRPRNGQGPAPQPMRPITRPTIEKPAATPATQQQVDAYEIVRAEAVAAGIAADWFDADPSTWAGPQIVAYTGATERLLAKRKAIAS